MEEQAPSQSAPIQPSSIPPVPVKQSNKSLVMATVLVFLLMTGGFVYFGYQIFQLQQKLNQFLVQQVDQTLILPTPVPEEMTDWKVYTSQRDKYSLKYPPDWTLLVGNSSLESLCLTINEPPIKSTPAPDDAYQFPIFAEHGDPEKYARFTISNTGESQSTVWEIASGWRGGTVETTTIDGREAAKVLQQPITNGGGSLVEGAYTLSIFVKNIQGQIMVIQLETANLTKYEPIFNQILSSFKFQP